MITDVSRKSVDLFDSFVLIMQWFLLFFDMLQYFETILTLVESL